GRAARLYHFVRAVQKSQHIQTHNRGRHHAKIRQRGIAAANTRYPKEDVAEFVSLGYLLHLRTRVGDGNETLAGVVLPNNLLQALEEILLVDIRLERAA